MDFYKKRFLNQKMMQTVLKALILVLLVAIYFNGLRVLVLAFVNILFAYITEYLFEKKINKKTKVSEALIVTALLYTMTLPVSIPFWISIVGIVFGIFFGKMVFGGFGKNVFNPALVGRCFIYINFPEPMTIVWNELPSGFPGGFTKWMMPVIDDVSTATPMLAYRNALVEHSYLDLLLGNVSGSIGEACKILIIICAIYLIVKKVASWEIMAGCILGFTAMTLIFNAQGIEGIPNPLYGMLSGGFLFGSVFMATDPISAAKTTPGKWCYSIIIGVVTAIIRGFALFSGGYMFAVLIGNVFAPIIDYSFNQRKKKKKADKEVATA